MYQMNLILHRYLMALTFLCIFTHSWTIYKLYYKRNSIEVCMTLKTPGGKFYSHV